MHVGVHVFMMSTIIFVSFYAAQHAVGKVNL